MISKTVLVAVEPWGERLDAGRAAAALATGLSAGASPWAVDVCPIERGAGGDDVGARLAAARFDARMRAARAVVVGAACLDERTLAGSATFEVATRARQAGVPAYAVTAVDRLSAFDARVLDLQVVLRARDARALRRAGERLAGWV